MITPLQRFIQITTPNSEMTDRMAQFMEALTRQVNQNTVLSDSGSPEGVITAEPTTLYMDTAGSAGSILYVKKTGAGDTGWILV